MRILRTIDLVELCCIALAVVLILGLLCATGCTASYVPILSDIEVAPIRLIEGTESLVKGKRRRPAMTWHFEGENVVYDTPAK